MADPPSTAHVVPSPQERAPGRIRGAQQAGSRPEGLIPATWSTWAIGRKPAEQAAPLEVRPGQSSLTDSEWAGS